MARKNSIDRLENVWRKRPVKDEPYSEFDLFSCIVDQVDLASIRPHELYAAIKAAQAARVEALDDEFALLSDDMITLATNEKNFVKVFKEDIRSGILRKTASETFDRVDEILAEQAAKNED